jgi:hypothetical protein
VLEEARQADSVVSKVRFFADDNDLVLFSLRIELEDFLAVIWSAEVGNVACRDSHECYTDHTQSNDNDLLPLCLRRQASIGSRLVRSFRLSTYRHAGRGCSPSHDAGIGGSTYAMPPVQMLLVCMSGIRQRRGNEATKKGLQDRSQDKSSIGRYSHQAPTCAAHDVRGHQ